MPALLLALLSAGVATPAAAPAACATPACAPHVSFAAPAEASAVVRWNLLARELAIGSKAPSFRAFALLSAAQSAALARASPAPAAALAAASSALLLHLFPDHASRIRAERTRQLAALSSTQPAAAVDQGVREGESVAASLWSERGARPLGTAPHPPNPGRFVWQPAPGESAEGFQDQFLQPWSTPAVEGAAPPPPPSPEQIAQALAEVRAAVARRTQQQASAARYWAGQEKGEVTPGLWNGIADRELVRRETSDAESARILSLLNRAMQDAAIACFRAKYRDWLARPTQLDPKLHALLHVPSFPSYPSAHACLSGAASQILARAFPDAEERIRALADEAAQSRVWAGLHYPFDGAAGLQLGRRVADRLLDEVSPH